MLTSFTCHLHPFLCWFPPQPNIELYRDDRSGFSYRIPDSTDVDTFRAAIEGLPGQESPEVYGLHPNADLTFRTLQVGHWTWQACPI